MLISNIQNASGPASTADATGIVIGVPLFNLVDPLVTINYNFWVFNSGNSAATLTIKACNSSLLCNVIGDFSDALISPVLFPIGKTRKVVKVIMMKSLTAGLVKLKVGDSGVINLYLKI